MVILIIGRVMAARRPAVARPRRAGHGAAQDGRDVLACADGTRRRCCQGHPGPVAGDGQTARDHLVVTWLSTLRSTGGGPCGRGRNSRSMRPQSA